MSKHYNIIIIGGGSAGMSAAVYAMRAGLTALILEENYHGGQAATTYEIDNYIGFDQSVSGPELMQHFHSHAVKFGAEFAYEQVQRIEDGEVKKVITANAEYTADAVIIATGAQPTQLGIEGEARLKGAGVSYCATCDGAFFKGKAVAVVGGGNTAVEDALFLAQQCEKVYLIHRRDALRADKILADKLQQQPKVQIIWNAVPVEIMGDGLVSGIKIKNVQTGSEQDLDVDGVFVAVGIKPNSTTFAGLVEMDQGGFIKTDEQMQTNIKGIFAAGDVRITPLRQVITAASDGAIASFCAAGEILRNSNSSVVASS